MFRSTFLLDHFLQAVSGSDPFVDYCHSRAIPFAPMPGAMIGDAEVRRWQDALGTLPAEERATINLELAQVNDLAHRGAIRHLVDACAGRGLPGALVAGEEAQALWFLVHQPAVFQEVFFHAEVEEVASWQNARALPGIALPDHRLLQGPFERELSRFFRTHEGTGQFCASRSYRLPDPECHLFVGYVADRPRLLDAFSDGGEHRRARIRPAARVLFAYYPADGTILLKARQRARSKVLGLLRAFARSVLQADVDEASLNARYDLECLKFPFDPPLPPGIALARLKAIELAYPPTEGRRRLRFETNAGDAPSAIAQLLASHVGEERLRRLCVVSAEIQVKFTIGGRLKSSFIRLWPNRCTLNQTPTAELLRRCLRTWGIDHAPRP
jgi:hypothetical protein